MKASIIFTGESLEGLELRTKTQTRRLLNPQPHPNHYLQPMWGRAPDARGRRGKGARFGERWLWREVGPDYPDGPEDDRRCPYGNPGAVLRVREAWCVAGEYDSYTPRKVPATATVHYLADGTKPKWAGRTRSPIFMPRWASRWEIKLLDVRLQQLTKISDADARAEGVEPCPYVDGHPAAGPGGCLCHLLDEPKPHVCTYREGWGTLHGETGPASWDADPWVWALTFEARRLRRRLAA